jgi:hypothetical protein
MNFDKRLDPLMQPFLDCFGHCDTPKRTKKETKDYRALLISLYNDIYAANETIFKDGCLQGNLLEIAKHPRKVRHPEGKDSHYFPVHIQQYINANETHQLIFTCGNIGQREITVIFTFFDGPKQIKEYTAYVRLMYIWLYICGQYADKTCTETLTVFIYPTPFLKKIPTNPSTVIGPVHINTAFTRACAKNGQIIIFREEEWFKVFIHETFHSYGLDFATQAHPALTRALRAIFPLDIDFNAYEAYAETWARIINCVFCSFNALQDKKNQSEFLSNLNFCLEMERMFALYQCVKVVGFMGLHYTDLNGAKAKHLYKENTHVFAYYVLTAIFLNDQVGFMLWCKENNTSLFKFKATPESFKKFATYISEKYECISLLDGIAKMGSLNAKVNKGQNKELMTTTRMSLIHSHMHI